jgi:hypothetical protein
MKASSEVIRVTHTSSPNPAWHPPININRFDFSQSP